MPRSSTPKTAVTCSNCGDALRLNDRNCRACGAAVRPCVRCGATLVAADRSCPQCGQPLDATQVTMRGSGRPSGPVAPSPWAAVVERLRAVTLGEYDIGYELGRGGMAAVFLAYDLALARHVAIKVMSPALLMGEGMVARFRQEARTIASLSHPGIITIYAVRQLADLHFFVMRFVEGRSLEHVLGVTEGGALPIGVVRLVLQQVASALAYAHRKGVVHRDVKPANILVDVDGNALVADFGIAKVTESSSHTQTGLVVGTPAYISPEQCMGLTVTGHSDQYSLGVVAYEMLTGAPPFSGNGFAILQAHTSRAPLPIRPLRPDCPEELEAAVLRMLAKDPATRFTNMTDAADALGAPTAGEAEQARAHLAALATPDETLRRRLAGPQSPAPVGRRRSSVASLIIPDLDHDVIRVGEQLQLKASAIDNNGWIIEHSPAWSSSDEGVATVSSDGVITALAPGAATIVARLGALEARVKVMVEAMPAAATEPDVPVWPAPRVQSSRPTLDVQRWPPESPSSPEPPTPAEPPILAAPAAVSEPAEEPEPRVSEPVAAIGSPELIDLMATTAPHAIDEAPPPAWNVGTAGQSAIADAESPAGSPVLRTILASRSARWGSALVAAVVIIAVVLRVREPGAAGTGDSARSSGAPAAATLQAAPVVAAATPDSSTSVADSAGGGTTAAPGRAAIASIAVAGPKSLAVGEFARLRAAMRDVNGTLVTRRQVKWRADSPTVATVDEYGTIQARATGTATFVATVEGKSGRFTLSVTATPQVAAGSAFDSAGKGGGGAGTGAVAASLPELLKARVNECVAVLQSFDPEPIRRYYSPYNDHAIRMVNALGGFASIGMAVRTVRDPRIVGDRASVEFSGDFSGRRGSAADWGPVEANMIADFTKGSNGSWALERCRIMRLGRM